MSKLNWFYNDRGSRSKWITERFDDVFLSAKSVLDVGCWHKDLEKFLPENIERYYGIDIDTSADLVINLDKIEKLPFTDGEFDIVVCADVLEHLENIHLITDELMRVADKNIIIALPVPATFNTFKNYIKGRIYKNSETDKNIYGKHSKFYGLPLDIPEDRHRWFFSADEAYDFLKYRAEKSGWEISSFESDSEYVNNKSSFIRKIFSLFTKDKNFFATSLVFCLKKK